MKKLFFLSILIVVTCLSTTAQTSMTPDLLWKLGRVGYIGSSPNNDFILYSVRKYNLEQNSGSSSYYKYDFATKTTIPFAKNLKEIHSLALHPALEKITFIKDNQVWMMNFDATGPIKISNLKGGFNNLKFSPDGNYIAFTKEVKLKKSTSDQYPNLPKANAKIIDDLMYRHWDHWTDEYYSHVFIAPIENGKVGMPKDIMEGEAFDCPQQPFGGAEDIIWSRDGKQLLYVSKKKEGKEYAISTNSEVYAFDILTNRTTNLSAGLPGYDMHPLYNHEGNKLAWLSMKRDGYESDKNDIIILDNNQRFNLTEQWDGTVSSFSWDETDKKIYFLAVINATYQIFELSLPKDLSKFNIEKNLKQLTKGQHNYTGFEKVGNSFIASRQDMNHATELFQVSMKDGSSEQITGVNDDIYGSIGLSKIEKRMVTTTDGKEMLTWFIYPPDFDPAKKYPTLLYCQGGPQSAVSQFYSFRWNFQLMAANGYIIVAPNRRGLPGFGTEWNEAISKDWGGQPMKDYLSAIDYATKLSFVDKDRLGAIGASYGGYSVYMLAGIHENRFKTFISHCGLFNLESWYGTTEELFFANFDIGGPYWDRDVPVSYLKHSPHKYAQNWNTPIMVIHGGKDFRVPETQGMEAFQVAQLKGIKSRFLYFPEESHWVLQPQNGVLWHTEFFRWLKETL